MTSDSFIIKLLLDWIGLDNRLGSNLHSRIVLSVLNTISRRDLSYNCGHNTNLHRRLLRVFTV